MNCTNIYAIGGLRNAGKDTAAEMLQYLLNAPKIFQNYWCFKHLKFKRGYTITSFAKPLKRTLGALLNIPAERFEDRDFKEHTYIYFPTMTITESPGTSLSDNRFSKAIAAKDFSFIKRHYISIRQLLQCFGTEIMRTFFGDQLWVILTLTDSKIIISDLRFRTECNAVKERGGKLIYIARPGCLPGNHASEKEVVELFKEGEFDHIIFNDGSKKELFNKLKDIINK